jgi:hypothetical protein
MIAGIPLTMFIYRFLMEPCWIIAALNDRLINQAAVYGHAFGALCLLLELGVATVVVTALWRFVTRGRRANQWVASLCMKRPARAVLGLALIYICIECGLWLLGTFSLQHPLTLGIGGIAFKWFNWQSVIIEMVIPVALLLWLARSRMKPQRA